MTNTDITQLITLMSTNSYSTNKKGVNQKIDYITKTLSDLPIKWTRYPDPQQIYGDFTIGKTTTNDPNKPNLGLILHADTVHTPQTHIEITQKGNRLYGPGALDMQASIYIVFKVLRKLHRQNKLHNLNILINTCEEKGSPQFQTQTKQLSQQLDYALVFEGYNSSDQELNKSNHHRLWHMTISSKGHFVQAFEASGPGGYSGEIINKADRKNAISHASQIIQALDKLANYQKQTTINIMHIEGGQENTTIAEHCRVVFGTRFKYESERTRLKTAIAKIFNTPYIPGIKLKDCGYYYDLPSWQPNANTQEFFKLVQKIGKKLKLEIQPHHKGGWSDGCNIYSYNPNCKVLDSFGPKGQGEHTKHEFVCLDTIKPAIDLSYQTITTLLS